MPTHGYDDLKARCEHLKACAAKVRAKYPNLIVGSSGWHRALSNQLRKRAT